MTGRHDTPQRGICAGAGEQGRCRGCFRLGASDPRHGRRPRPRGGINSTIGFIRRSWRFWACCGIAACASTPWPARARDCALRPRCRPFRRRGRAAMPRSSVAVVTLVEEPGVPRPGRAWRLRAAHTPRVDPRAARGTWVERRSRPRVEGRKPPFVATRSALLPTRDSWPRESAQGPPAGGRAGPVREPSSCNGSFVCRLAGEVFPHRFCAGLVQFADEFSRVGACG